MGVSQNGSTQHWMVYAGPIEMDDDWGYPHDSGNHHQMEFGNRLRRAVVRNVFPRNDTLSLERWSHWTFGGWKKSCTRR